ncbi:MAG: DUF6316 family protein [Pseudomonadota bacterium]
MQYSAFEHSTTESFVEADQAPTANRRPVHVWTPTTLPARAEISDSAPNTTLHDGDRIFRDGDAWFFAARSKDIGPFNTRRKAEAALTRYVRRKNPLTPSRPAFRVIKKVARRTSRRLLPLSA